MSLCVCQFVCVSLFVCLCVCVCFFVGVCVCVCVLWLVFAGFIDWLVDCVFARVLVC